MARTKSKLKDVKLNEISFVGKGDNPEAHLLILKIKKEEGIVSLGKGFTEEKADALSKWMEDNAKLMAGLLKEDGEACTFAEIQNDKNLREKVWDMCWTLEDSLGSIIRDETVSDKTAMIQQSIDQFKAAITALTKGGPEMPEKMKKEMEELQTKLSGLEKQVEDLTKENAVLKATCDDKDKKMKEMEDGKVKKEDEEVYKALPEAVVKELKQSREEIQKLKDENIRREYISKAAEVTNIGKADEIGDLLRDIAKEKPELANRVFEVLKTADVRIKEGDLLKEKGTGGGDGEVKTAYDKLTKKAEELRKEKPELTFAKAFTIVYDTEHDLRKQYEDERSKK